MDIISKYKRYYHDLTQCIFGCFIFYFLYFTLVCSGSASEVYCLPTSYWNQQFGVDEQADFIAVGKVGKAIQLGIFRGANPKSLNIDHEQHFIAAILLLKITKILKGDIKKIENVSILELNECDQCNFERKISTIVQNSKYNISYFVAARSHDNAEKNGPLISKGDISFLNQHKLKFDYTSYHCRNAFLVTDSKEYVRILKLVENTH